MVLDIAELVSQRGEDPHTKVNQLLKAYHLKFKNLMKSIKRLSANQKNILLQNIIHVNVQNLNFAVEQDKIRYQKKRIGRYKLVEKMVFLQLNYKKMNMDL